SSSAQPSMPDTAGPGDPRRRRRSIGLARLFRAGRGGRAVTTVIVKRPPRRPAPPLPSGEVVLEPPPEIPPPSGKAWTRMLMVLPMAAGAAAMGLMMGVQRGGPLIYVAGAMYGVSILGMIGMMVLNQQGPGKKEMIQARRQYMRRLAQLRAQVRTTVRQQREAIYYRHPDPDALWSIVGG